MTRATLADQQRLIDHYRRRDALQLDIIRRQRRWIDDLMALAGAMYVQAATDAALIAGVTAAGRLAAADAWPGRVD